VFYRLSPYVVMVGTVVWPANYIFLLGDSGNTKQEDTSDNAGRLEGSLAESGASCGARVSPVFHAALLQTGDVGKGQLQGICNLFGPLTIATITRSKN
jgi:hypothetical protein